MKFSRCAVLLLTSISLSASVLAQWRQPVPCLSSSAGRLQVRLAALKREEDSISKERDTLEVAKMRHIRSGLVSILLPAGGFV